jgi:hypothetical protein
LKKSLNIFWGKRKSLIFLTARGKCGKINSTGGMNMKRIISFLLIVIMMLSHTITASASNFGTSDALTVLRAVAGLVTLTVEQVEKYDMNGDGMITTADAMAILQYIAENPPPLPPPPTGGSCGPPTRVLVYGEQIYESARMQFYGDDFFAVLGERIHEARSGLICCDFHFSKDEVLRSLREAEIYEVKGYNKDFFVAIISSNGASRWLDFYQNFDNANMTTGEDLFGDELLRLRGRVVRISFLDGFLSTRPPGLTLVLSQADIETFVNDLYAGKLYENYNEIRKEFQGFDLYGEHWFRVGLLMENGITIWLSVFGNGFVTFNGQYIRIPVETFNIISNSR